MFRGGSADKEPEPDPALEEASHNAILDAVNGGLEQAEAAAAGAAVATAYKASLVLKFDFRELDSAQWNKAIDSIKSGGDATAALKAVASKQQLLAMAKGGVDAAKGGGQWGKEALGGAFLGVRTALSWGQGRGGAGQPGASREEGGRPSEASSPTKPGRPKPVTDGG